MNIPLAKNVRNVLLAACATVAVSGIAFAQSPKSGAQHDRMAHAGMMHKEARGAHGMRGAPLMRAIRQLDLTDAQRQSIRSMFESSAPQREALRQRHIENATALAATLPNDPNYPALIEAQKKLAADAIQQRSELQTQVFSLLTPEQQAKVPEVLAERKDRMEQRRKEMREQIRERREATGA